MLNCKVLVEVIKNGRGRDLNQIQPRGGFYRSNLTLLGRLWPHWGFPGFNEVRSETHQKSRLETGGRQPFNSTADQHLESFTPNWRKENKQTPLERRHHCTKVSHYVERAQRGEERRGGRWPARPRGLNDPGWAARPVLTSLSRPNRKDSAGESGGERNKLSMETEKGPVWCSKPLEIREHALGSVKKKITFR